MKADDLTWRVIDKPGESFKVHRSIYTDPEIFELEMKAIWEGNWIFLAHEAQIPNPNDYLSLFMGRQPVIITRDAKGELHGFINACSHRGANICRKAKGNAKTFSCPYHGWVYNNQGQLLDVKAKAQGGYTAEWESRNYNLTPVPRVESYKGFIFGSLSEAAENLDAHLGPAKVFIDQQVEQAGGADQIEVVRGSSVYTHRGNWKMQAENGVDGYHADIVHKSYFTLAMDRFKKAAKNQGEDSIKAIQIAGQDLQSGNYDLGNGHVMIWADVANPRDRAAGFKYDAMLEELGELKTKWVASRLRQTLFYPNFILFDGISTQLRSWRPITKDLTEVTAYCFGIKGEPTEARERRVRQYEDFYGASGVATPDDLTEFDACQSGYYGIKAEWQDFDRGMMRRIVGPDSTADAINLKPVVSAGDVADETLYHGEYRHWLRTLIEAVEKG